MSHQSRPDLWCVELRSFERPSASKQIFRRSFDRGFLRLFRSHASSPPVAKIKPGRPAPAIGPGTPTVVSKVGTPPSGRKNGGEEPPAAPGGVKSEDPKL